MNDASWFRPRTEWRPYAPTPASSCRRSDDAILDDVGGQLADHSGLDARDVDVSVLGGRVTLRGSVPTREQKRIAEAIAESTPGVREIVDRLRVRGQSASDRAA